MAGRSDGVELIIADLVATELDVTSHQQLRELRGAVGVMSKVENFRWPEAATTRPLFRLLLVALAIGVATIAAVVLFGVSIGLAQITGAAFPTVAALEDVPGSVGTEYAIQGTHAVLFALVALAVLVATMIVYQRRASSLLAPSGRIWIFYGAMGVLIAVFAQVVPGIYWLAGQNVGDMPLFRALSTGVGGHYLLSNALFLLVMAAAEEIVFRGALLHVSRTFTERVWVLCIFNGLLFSAAHSSFDLVPFLARFASGMLWTWLTLRTGSIAFAVASHWVGNLYISLFVTPVSLASDEGSTWVDLLCELSTVALTAGLLLLVIHRVGPFRALKRSTV